MSAIGSNKISKSCMNLRASKFLVMLKCKILSSEKTEYDNGMIAADLSPNIKYIVPHAIPAIRNGNVNMTSRDF